MAFNSAGFIALFVLFFALYSFMANRVAWRIGLLLVFNLLFYFMLSKWGIFILLGIGCSDYLIARSMNGKSENNRKWLLYLAVILDIGAILCFRHFTDWFGLNELFFWPKVIGISFFIFRSMGYVLDVYRETVEDAETHLPSYLAYLSFFPLIMAGPISPARDFIPQLKKPFEGSEVPVSLAFFFIGSGIVKNYILSNYIAANFVNRVFESPSYFSGLENLIASIGQALVVYTDFSGYTDLMTGIALLLGFRIAENFNFPYLSRNITEYWRRWHMSLSQWLNEYLFFPLSFALRRWKKTGTIAAVFTTFVISGFWHGTAFHYTFWGLLHGLALGWDILSGPTRVKLKSITNKHFYNATSIFLTFGFLALSGIFFKVNSMENGSVVLDKIFFHTDFQLFPAWLQAYRWVFASMITILIVQYTLSKHYNNIVAWFAQLPYTVSAIGLAVVIFITYQIAGMGSLPFIYLEF